MVDASIDDRLAVEHPELFVLDLLRHTLAAAYRALAVVHPEVDDHGDLGPIDEQCHCAILLGIDVYALEHRIVRYRAAVEAATVEDEHAAADLPF